MDSSIGIIILAAGSSQRLGLLKQLVEVEGKTLIRRAVETAMASPCETVLVVLGSNSDAIASEVTDLEVQTVFNNEWEEGISSSIRAGLLKLLELEPNIDAAVFMLSDQPFVDETTITALISSFRSTRKPIVASAYGGVVGVPALFAREVFDELMALKGDAGARVVIRQSVAERIATVDAPEAAFDLDTPQDHQRLLEPDRNQKKTAV
jgi:molybdenum cofactor cytidylyltransferase